MESCLLLGPGLYLESVWLNIPLSSDPELVQNDVECSNR